MSRKTKNDGIHLLKGSTILVSSLLLLASASSASANPGNGRRAEFRELRRQNPDMNRSALRERLNENRRRGDNTRVQVLPLVQGRDEIVNCVLQPSWLPKTMNHRDIRARGQSSQADSNGFKIELRKGLDLDLNSDSRNIVLGKNLFRDFESVRITIGDKEKTLGAGCQVSAAEYVAVKQVLAAGSQQISINEAGCATGGEVDLSALTAKHDVLRAANFVVAANVTTYGDFSKHSDFRLLGDLDNYGTIHALSTDGSVKHGTIAADNINNTTGATIHSDVDLTLEATGSLKNEGIISSNGSLTLTASTSVDNIGTIRAAGNVNLATPTVHNRGLTESRTGDININGDFDTNIDNTKGTLSAINGAINVRTPGYAGHFSSTVNGGDLLSKELNLNSGSGLASVSVNQLTGMVNETGNAAHVLAATTDLNIGTVCLTGDPTFFNSQGGISITGDITVSEALVIAGAGDISVSSNVDILAGNSNQGFDITLIAGAAITPVSGSDSPTVPPGTTGAISLSGKASKTGGSILLGNNVTVSAIADEAAPVGDNNGANINMFALAGKATGSGLIDLKAASIFTGGFGNGSNGNVVLVAGGKSDYAIETGVINTTGGAGTAGNLTVVTAQPVSSDKKLTIDYSAQGIRSGSQLVASSKTTKGAGIYTYQFVAGDDILLSGTGNFTAGGELYVQSELQADSFVFDAHSVVSGFNPGPIRSGDLTITSTIVGRLNEDLFVDTADVLNVNAKGDIVNITVVGAGAGGGPQVNLYGEDDVWISSLARPLNINSVTGMCIILQAPDFSNIGTVSASSELTIEKTSPTATPISGQFSSLDKLTLIDGGGGVGTSGAPVLLDNVGNFTGLGKNVFVRSVSKKETDFTIHAINTARVESVASMRLTDALADNGTFLAQVESGTLTVAGNVRASDGLTLQNTGTKSSSKISFAENSNVFTFAKSAGLGNVDISVGPTGSPLDNQGPFDNVTIQETGGGQVVINGPGVAADGPVTFTGSGGILTINNGFKEGNIALGANVAITADPPVPDGSPVNVIQGRLLDSKPNQFVITATQLVAPSSLVNQPAKILRVPLILQSDWSEHLINTQILDVKHASTL